jgi:hypothetical protein
MTDRQIADLTDDELLQEKKNLKSRQIMHALLIGVFMGIAVYSAVKNGWGFATFFPLFFVYLLLKNGKRSQAIEAELSSRTPE